MIERRSTNGKITKDGNRLSGLASPTYNGDPGTEFQLYDGVVERFAPGAFDEHLATNPDVVALFNHDTNVVLGRTPQTLKLRSDAQGLHYEIDLSGSITQAAKDLKISVARGDIKGSSFAFIPERIEWQKDGAKDVRLIRQATLHDVSPVVTPAYGSTTVFVRSAEERQNLEAERDAYHQKLTTAKWMDRISKL